MDLNLFLPSEQGLISLFLLHADLQEPVVGRDAGQPGAGTAILVERVLLRQAYGRIPPSKTLEPRHTLDMCVPLKKSNCVITNVMSICTLLFAKDHIDIQCCTCQLRYKMFT